MSSSDLIERTYTAVDADAALSAYTGVTSTDARLIVLRALAPNVEMAMRQLTAVWSAWRRTAWGCAPAMPRLWRT